MENRNPEASHPLNVFDVLKSTFGHFGKNIKFIIKASLPLIFGYILLAILFIVYMGLDNIKILFNFTRSSEEMAQLSKFADGQLVSVTEHPVMFILAGILIGLVLFILKTIFTLTIFSQSIEMSDPSMVKAFKKAAKLIPLYIKNAIVFGFIALGFVSVVAAVSLGLGYLNSYLGILSSVIFFLALVFLSVRVSQMVAILISEKKIGIKNIMESFALTRGKFWMIFLNIFVWMVISLIAIFVTGFLFNILSIFIPLFGLGLQILFGLWILAPLAIIFAAQIFKRITPHHHVLPQNGVKKSLKTSLVLGVLVLVVGLCFGFYFMYSHRTEIAAGYDQMIEIIKNPELTYTDSKSEFSIKYPRNWGVSPEPLLQSAVVSIVNRDEASLYVSSSKKVTPTYINILAYKNDGTNIEYYKDLYHQLAENKYINILSEEPVKKIGEASVYRAYLVWNSNGEFGEVDVYSYPDMNYIISTISGKQDFSEAEQIISTFAHNQSK
ncbi:MAG: hypothetical protein JWP09_746 [Candidatus Taylorbacteria bacterium]|nr:hypothetical protein [Candidatus Taylorbacteria bacterium]